MLLVSLYIYIYSQILLCFALQPVVFEIHVILRQANAPNNPKWLWILQGQRYPIFITTFHGIQISLSFALWPVLFEIWAILKQVHQMTSNDLESHRVKGTPYMCYYFPRVPNFTLFCSTTSCFWDTGKFKTNALNDPKMSLNPIRSKVPHICFIGVHISQISLCFAPHPSIFEIRPLWGHRMTPKWPEGHMYPIYLLQVSMRPIFCFAIWPAVFQIQAILRQVHHITPNWHWTISGQIMLYMYN